MRENDLIKSVEPIIDEITELNKRIDNVKTIKGDKGDGGEQGEKGAQGEQGETGIGVNTKEWTKGIYRKDQIVQHFIGQQFKALKDTDKEPSHGEDWERIGTNGFRWTGVKSDKTKYEDGDLFIDSGTTFLMVDGKAKMFAQRGKNAVDGKDGVDGKAAREFVHVKWHSKGISFVYDDGEIIEADVDGLNEIQKRMTFIEEMFESNETIDAPIKRYAGVYKINKSYAVGDTVTEAKSLYLCIKADANSNSLDLDKWVKICNSQGSGGKGNGGEFLPLAGGTMTGIIGSTSKEFAKLKLNSLQEINVLEGNGGLDINLQPQHSSIFRIADGNKAGLTIDGKHLVTASKEQDDELIKDTASDYYLTTRKYVLDRVKENNDLIVELEEEIDAIVPASERGSWNVVDADSPLRPPKESGSFYMMDASDIANVVITREFADVTSMIISKTDRNGASHPFTAAKVGDHIELFESADSDFLLAKIVGIDNSNADYVMFSVERDSFMGGLVGTGVSARIKVFDLSAGLLLESLMPKSGGTFTGDVLYLGAKSDLKHLATQQDASYYTLTSGSETYNKKSAGILYDNQFGVTVSNVGSTNAVYLNKLFLTNEYGAQSLSIYSATYDTWFEVYKSGVLILKMQVKRSSWKESTYNKDQIQFTGAFPYPLYGASENWSTSTNYKIKLSGLRRK